MLYFAKNPRTISSSKMINDAFGDRWSRVSWSDTWRIVIETWRCFSNRNAELIELLNIILLEGNNTPLQSGLSNTE